MTRDPIEGPDAEASQPSKALAGIGAALPFAFSLGCCLSVPLAGGGGPDGAAHFAQEMGFAFYGILLMAPLSGALAGALVGVAGTGRRLPVVLAIFAGALPWLVGLAGHRYGLYQVEQAIAAADPSNRAAMMAAGISESSTSHLFGAAVSAGVLLGVALGLALGAMGQRAPRRSFLGAGFALLALPLLAAAAWSATSAGISAAAQVAVALGALLVTALGGASVGVDEPRFRSGALAAGAVTAAALSFVAASSVATTGAMVAVFRAMANVDPASRIAVLSATAEELAPATTVSSYGVLLALLPVLGVAVWAALRGRVSAGKLVGATAAILVMLLVTGLDAFVVHAGPAALAELVRPPWGEHPSFEPVALGGYDVEEPARSVDVLVVEGSVVPTGDLAPVPVGAGEEAVATRLRQVLPDAAPSDAAPDGRDPSAGLLGVLEGVTGEGELPTPEPSIAIAFDRRTDAATMRRVVEAAHAAGARSIWWAGLYGSTVSPEERERLLEALPLLGTLAEQPTAVRVRLGSSIPGTYAGMDPDFLHGTIAQGATELTLTPREGSSSAPVLLSEQAGYAPNARDGERDVAYLLVGDGASVQDVARIVGFAADQGLTPVLYFDQLPPSDALAGQAGGILGVLGSLDEDGSLSAALEALDALGGGGTGEGTIGLGNLGALGGGPRADDGGERASGRVRTSGSMVRGSLSRDVIQRVIRRHVNEARYCYEQELANDPSLTGRVNVSFIIGPTGAVQSAAVEASTLSSSAVESCVVAAVRRWTFPAPDGGGVVAVNYPFVFTTR